MPRPSASGQNFAQKVMANTILIGAQWGDEGKGKIIDVLTDTPSFIVARSTFCI